MDLPSNLGDADIRPVELFLNDYAVMLIAELFSCDSLHAFRARMVGRTHSALREMSYASVVLGTGGFFGHVKTFDCGLRSDPGPESEIGRSPKRCQAIALQSVDPDPRLATLVPTQAPPARRARPRGFGSRGESNPTRTFRPGRARGRWAGRSL